jgi:hypothetical protein
MTPPQSESENMTKECPNCDEESAEKVEAGTVFETDDSEDSEYVQTENGDYVCHGCDTVISDDGENFNVK